MLRVTNAYFQSTDSLAQLGNSGIYYEVGSIESAKLIQNALPMAMNKVENNQFKPFNKSPNIFVFATKQSFSKYSGSPLMARGAVFNGSLYISPRAIKTNTVKQILTHELSHMHFHQYIESSDIPAWFSEGMAVLVSDGAGAENVTREAAVESILSGHSIKPNESGSLLFPKTANYFGLETHMFYRQSLMFVSHLKHTNSERFELLINKLLGNTKFKTAFEESFGESVDALWVEFTNTLKPNKKFNNARSSLGRANARRLTWR